MSDFVKRAAGLSDQYLSALADSQEQFLKSLTSFPAWTPKAAPTAFPPAASLAPELPTPQELIEANFAFATKLLKQQKDFTEKLIAATTQG
jgi:hypothetical protein